MFEKNNGEIEFKAEIITLKKCLGAMKITGYVPQC